MAQHSIFRWKDGGGWLVLSGGGDSKSEAMLDIDAAILRRTISHNPLAYIWAAGDIESADRYLEHIEDLGGRTGFLIDVITEDDETIKNQLNEAGIIVLGDGENLKRLSSGLAGAALEAISNAYANGATIYGQGRAAAILASWVNFSGKDLSPGLGWVEGAVIVSGYNEDHAADVKQWLQDLPGAYGIGLGAGSALALNAEGDVEIWGEQKVTVLLGKNLASPE